MAASSLTIDDRSRRLLRSIGPENGQVDIRLHDMARELEQLAGLATAPEAPTGDHAERAADDGGANDVPTPPSPLSPGTAAG